MSMTPDDLLAMTERHRDMTLAPLDALGHQHKLLMDGALGQGLRRQGALPAQKKPMELPPTAEPERDNGPVPGMPAREDSEIG